MKFWWEILIMFMGKIGVALVMASLLTTGLVYGEEDKCYCLQNQDTDELIFDCGPVKGAKGTVRHACNDFKTKDRREVSLQEATHWRVVEEGKIGCTPCKYVHPTVTIPQGGSR